MKISKKHYIIVSKRQIEFYAVVCRKIKFIFRINLTDHSLFDFIIIILNIFHIL